MPRKPSDSVLAAIVAEPWAILPSALEQIIAIAGRLSADPEAALAKRRERGDPFAAARNGSTAIIPVYGPIFPRAGCFDRVSGATSVSALSGMLDAALADGEVDSILLDIDSPGGQVTGIHEFAARLRSAAEAKPLAAYVSGMAASAAYWIAAAAGHIVADRTAKTGSIGVVYAWTDDSAARKSQGLRDYAVVSSQSPNKNVDPKTPEGRSELQAHADALAEIFIDDVAAFRGTTAAAVLDGFGQGGLLLAESALEAGMVDEIGCMDAALEGLAPRGRELITKGNAMAVKLSAPAAQAAADGGGKARGEEDEEQKPKDEEEEENASADGEDEEDEEDKPEDGAKSKKELKKAKALNPAVFEAAYAAGVADERARIMAIRDLGIAGHKKLVENAMFNAPTTAEKLALAVVKADQAARAAASSARLEESARMAVPAASVIPGDRTGNAAEEAALIKAMAGK